MSSTTKGQGAEPRKESSSERFYGKDWPLLVAAREQLDAMADEFTNLSADAENFDDLRPVVYHTSRIKSPSSLSAKIAKRVAAGGQVDEDASPLDAAAALAINDVIGLRMICAFGDDVYATARWFASRDDVEVIKTKDYIANPKPNGYRSLHLILRLTDGPASYVPAVEVQIRTIATDCWATLEHKMKYKKSVAHSELMSHELKRCADEIASVDISMQTLRNAIRDAE